MNEKAMEFTDMNPLRAVASGDDDDESLLFFLKKGSSRRRDKSIAARNEAYFEMNVPRSALALYAEVLANVFEVRKSFDWRKVVRWGEIAGALGPVIAFAFIAGYHKAICHDNPLVAWCLGIIVLIGGWWLSAPWPKVATSFAPVWLFPLTGVLSTASAASSYINGTVMLLIGAFLVNSTIEESGVGNRAGLYLVGTFGSNPLSVLLGLNIFAYLLSFFAANLSSLMMVLPFALSIIERIEESNPNSPDDARRFSKAAVMSITRAVSIGGMVTPISAPGNMILLGVMAKE